MIPALLPKILFLAATDDSFSPKIDFSRRLGNGGGVKNSEQEKMKGLGLGRGGRRNPPLSLFLSSSFFYPLCHTDRSWGMKSNFLFAMALRVNLNYQSKEAIYILHLFVFTAISLFKVYILEKKQCWMRDFREKGAGKRVRTPPFNPCEKTAQFERERMYESCITKNWA